MLGDVPLGPEFNVALEYTPLLTAPQSPHYYGVSLLALRVGNKQLDIPQVHLGASLASLGRWV